MLKQKHCSINNPCTHKTNQQEFQDNAFFHFNTRFGLKLLTALKEFNTGKANIYVTRLHRGGNFLKGRDVQNMYLSALLT